MLTTVGLKTWPSNSAGVTVTSGAGIGVLGSWTEIVAAGAIAGPMQIAGFCAQLTGEDRLEIQVGIGASGEEIAISKPLLVSAGSGNLALETFMLPLAIAGIPSGSRVALRTRSDGSGVAYVFTLMYSTGISDDASTPYSYEYAPYVSTGGHQTGAVVIPSATPWANSPWVELLPVLGRGSALMGIAPSYSSSNYDGIEYEVDLGFGALGAEVAVTTIRSIFSSVGVQGFTTTWLPAPHRLLNEARVSFRVRKAGTTTDQFETHVLYLDIPPPMPPSTTTFPTVRERIFALPFETKLMLFLERIEFLVQAGEGLVTGQGSDPRIAVWFSKDGGKTYGNGYTLQAGKIGEYDKRSYLNRLGRARNWVCKMRVSDPVFWAFLDCIADISEGTS